MIQRTPFAHRMLPGLLLAVGCAPSPGAAPPRITLGISSPDAPFRPYSDGEDTDLVYGAQGGFHVWMSYRGENLPEGRAQLDRRAHRLSDGALTLRTSGTVELPPADASGHQDSPKPFPMFMCPSPIGLSVIDTPIVFELDLQREEGGPLARQSITLVPHCPDEGRDFCLRICTG